MMVLLGSNLAASAYERDKETAGEDEELAEKEAEDIEAV
jgi:hypothetical protein